MGKMCSLSRYWERNTCILLIATVNTPVIAWLDHMWEKRKVYSVITEASMCKKLTVWCILWKARKKAVTHNKTSKRERAKKLFKMWSCIFCKVESMWVPKAYWVTCTVMLSRTKDRGSLVKVRPMIQPRKNVWLRKLWEKRGKKKRQGWLESKNKSLEFEKMQVHLPCSPLVTLILL